MLSNQRRTFISLDISQSALVLLFGTISTNQRWFYSLLRYQPISIDLSFDISINQQFVFISCCHNAFYCLYYYHFLIVYLYCPRDIRSAIISRRFLVNLKRFSVVVKCASCRRKRTRQPTVNFQK